MLNWYVGGSTSLKLSQLTLLGIVESREGIDTAADDDLQIRGRAPESAYGIDEGQGGSQSVGSPHECCKLLCTACRNACLT